MTVEQAMALISKAAYQILDAKTYKQRYALYNVIDSLSTEWKDVTVEDAEDCLEDARTNPGR